MVSDFINAGAPPATTCVTFFKVLGGSIMDSNEFSSNEKGKPEESTIWGEEWGDHEEQQNDDSICDQKHERVHPLMY